MTCQEKASAKLLCRLSAVPKEVCWFKGQTALEVSSKYVMKQSGAEVQLIIQSLSPDDAGEYRCQTGNCETKATLTVEGNVKNVLTVYSVYTVSSIVHLQSGFSLLSPNKVHHLDADHVLEDLPS